MIARITIDKAGRVVLPKSLRDELQLQAGDELELESEAQQVTLRPVRQAAPLRKERGVWVFHGSTKLSAAHAEQLVHESRERRSIENRGTE
jgi:AbrB family looped-hinge helix DNA binding protein